MPIYKVSYIYSMNLARDAGWSENFYIDRTNAESTRAVALKLAAKLNTVHGYDSVLDVVRISNTETKRDSILIEYNSNAVVNPGQTQDLQSDYPTTALLIELTGTTGGGTPRVYRTRQWLKGIPDDIIRAGFYNPGDTGINKKIAGLEDMLASDDNNWVMRCQNVNTTEFGIFQITNPGTWTIPGSVYNPNDKVLVKKVAGPQKGYLNKVWKIKEALGAGQYTVWGWNPPTTFEYDLTNAVAVKREFVYPNIDRMEVKRSTSRQVGRPFAVLSGSRRRQN